MLSPLAPSLLTADPVKAAAEDGRIIINEIRLGGDPIALDGNTALTEYVTLFNSGSTATTLEGWALEYAKSASPLLAETFCMGDWQSQVYQANVLVSRTPLDSISVPSGSVSVPIVRQLNDTGPGSLRLVQLSGEQTIIQDLVGWGGVGSPPPCQEGEHTSAPVKSKSLQRYVECDSSEVIDTDNNKSDFAVDQESNPIGVGRMFAPDCAPAGEATSCNGLTITEILPNPAGTDSGKEFLEIHNPTEAVILLDGCKVSVGNDIFSFSPGLSIQPQGYLAFYDTETKLTLVNSTGGSVVLSTQTTSQEFPYPAEMGEGISWAFIEALWQATDSPTPGTENQPGSSNQEGKGSGDEELDPCPPGKFRNPQTNRCKSITLASVALKPCDPGQFRNPETNRCKSMVTAGASLKPCSPDQERNPDTNRCRSVLSASSQLKPCKEGQERNPETNRCRNVATLAKASPGGKDASNSGTENNKKNYAIIGAVVALAVGYGLYEYRIDIKDKFASAKARIFSDSEPN